MKRFIALAPASWAPASWALASWALASWALASCLTVSTARAQALTPVTINYGVAQFIVSTAAIFSIPRAMGFWQEEGLDVTAQGADGAGTALQQLIAGRVAMTLTGLPSAMELINKGAPIKIVASAYKDNVFYPVVLEDSPIRTIQDFKDRTIGVTALASTNTIWMKAIAKAYGLNPDRDLRLIGVGSGAAPLQALLSHRLDALQLFEAEYDADEGPNVRFRRFNDLPVLKDLSFVQGLMMSQADIQSHPKLVAGLLRGIAKATIWASAHPEDAVRLHWKTFPLTKPQGVDEASALAHASLVLRHQLAHYTQPFGLADAGKIVATRDALFEFGGLTRKQEPDDYYTAAFIAQANDFDPVAIAALPPRN
jgi:NitT/TauT family transport system substrate-binding protein